MDQDKKSYLRLLKNQKKEKNWDAMLVSAQEGIKAFPESNKFWKYLHYAQVHYVDQKLNSDLVHELEKKDDYSELIKIYKRLLMVFPESKKLKKRMKRAKTETSKQSMLDQKVAIQEAQIKIKSLMKEGRLEAALTAAYEILSYVPLHKDCQKLKMQILAKREKIINKELGAIFNKSYKLVKAEYKANKKSVIRL